MKRLLFLYIVLFVFSQRSFGQENEINTSSSVDVDEIEVIVKSSKLSAKGDTSIVILSLQSYLKNPRELKLNTFASGVLGPDGKPMFYDSMTMGKVNVFLASHQNYLHYLLTRDDVVPFVIKTPKWQKHWGVPKIFRLTLEEHTEEGKFIQVDIPL